ncbi:hypothetical protein GALL_436780 [mine drainage metagenome]|uniref:Uncharacterized protein n=1 Tax=mine drainage metagenome TaxID=410659 RepID=A0A1J5QAZ2_9ZZZZ
MSPARTSRAPIHNTPTIPVNTRKITITVITARAPIRLRAAVNDFSVTSANTASLCRSCVNACTVCTELSASDALPEDCAIQSWFSRLNPRRRRPSTMIGTTTTGTISNTNPVSLAEVSIISTRPPSNINKLRSATDTEDPITDKISVVSVVNRLSTSPVRIFSKNAGLMPITRSNSALRMSATTRSPSRVTR